MLMMEDVSRRGEFFQLLVNELQQFLCRLRITRPMCESLCVTSLINAIPSDTHLRHCSKCLIVMGLCK